MRSFRLHATRTLLAMGLQLLLAVVFLSCDGEPSSCRKACESDQICKTEYETMGYCGAEGVCEVADCESDADCGEANPDVRCIRANGRGSCGVPCDSNGECDNIYSCRETTAGLWKCVFDCRAFGDDLCVPAGLVCSPETGECACSDDEACGEGKVCR